MTTPNKSDLFTHYVTYDVVYDDPVNSGSNSFGNGLGAVYDRADFLTINSATTPGFRRKKKYQLPFHNYSKDRNKWDDPGTTMTQRYHDHGVGYNYDRLYTYHGANVLFNGADVGDGGVVLDERDSELINKIRAKLQQNKTNLAVTAAEFHKTANMVSVAANRVYQAVSAVRHANLVRFAAALGLDPSLRQSKRWQKKFRESRFGPAGSTERAAAQMWLEYSYGWKPLLNDVYTSAEALANAMTEKSNLIRWVSANVSSSVSINRSVPLRNWIAKTSGKKEMTKQMKIAYRIDTGALNTANIFGLTNPLTVAWELVPFSFVADWFLPIGQALQDLTATSDLVWAGGFINRKYVLDIQTTYAPGSPWYPSGVTGVGPWWTAESGSMKFSQSQFVFSRVGMSGFPGPQFPKFKNPLSPSHATSAIALLSSLFRR